MEVQPLDAHLLTRCLRRGRDDGLPAELRGMDGDGWRRLVDRAVWLGVGPLLHYRLRQWEDLGIPPEQHVRLRDLYHHSLLRNQAILEQLLEVLRETSGAGQPVLALKGAHLAYCVYEEPAVRPLGDIDILAPPDRAADVLRHLETLGYGHAAWTEAIDYSQLHHLRPLARAGGVDVEVHHTLAPLWAPFQHDLAGLWERSTHTRVGDFELPHLATDDLLLHVCTHAAFDDEFRLGLPALCDVDVVVRKMGPALDWARLAQTANADGRARFAYAFLRLAREILGTPIAEDVLASLHHDATDDEIVTEAATHLLSMNRTSDVPDTLRSVGDAMTPWAKIAKLWQGVFPPPATLRRIYGLEPGSRLQYLYYAVRPLDLLVRGGRWLLRSLDRSPRARATMENERRRRRIRAWARRRPQGGPPVGGEGREGLES